MVFLRVTIAVVSVLLCGSVEVVSVSVAEHNALCKLWTNLKPFEWVREGFEPCRTDFDICAENKTVKCQFGHVHDMFGTIDVVGCMSDAMLRGN